MKPLDPMDFDALQYSQQGFNTLDNLAASQSVEQMTEKSLQSIKTMQTPTVNGFIPKHVTLPIFEPKTTEAQFFIHVQNEQKGPFTSSEIEGLLSAGQINYQTMAWATGMTSWGTIQTCLQFVQQK